MVEDTLEQPTSMVGGQLRKEVGNKVNPIFLLNSIRGTHWYQILQKAKIQLIVVVPF